ncbi:hypothetical protein PybrP1_008989 [[Pythium] brassicae (nom. inval.)]|nr:hypothetical protein PybrP1_008989 [[Pythium] brassicae (nom. inval.)]
MSTPKHRELATQLLAAQSVGIAGFIQERVHSTTVGVDATAAFLRQLLQELEDAAAEYVVPGRETLEHAHEVELGSLLTAASLSVRYTTEAEAMVPLLDRFRDVFSDVLFVDSWTPAFLGLKTVALMASTRVLESFSTRVDDEDVEQELKKLLEIFVPAEENEHQWLMDLFAPQDAELGVRKADYMLRPLCEYVSVASQTHESATTMIYATVLPQLMTLVQRFGDEYAGDVRVADATLSELASTVAALLDAKMPRAASDVFALLSLPSFVDGAAVSDAATADDADDDADEPESPIKFANGDSTIFQCVATLCGWLRAPGRRTSASIVLPLLGQAIYLNDPEQNNTDMVATIVEALVASLRELELNTLADFEFAVALLEAFREVALRVRKLATTLVSAMYAELREVVARLEAALKSSAIAEKELSAVKASCSKARQTLVEAFVAWIHRAGASSSFPELLTDFLGETSTKLADPRVYGDVIYAVRQRAAVDSETDVTAVVDTCVGLLARALKQLDRYPKTTASNIVSAVTRVSSASRQFVAPYADELAAPLLSSIIDGSSKGKVLRSRLEAVACVVIGSSADEAFELDAHPWTNKFLGVLLESACSGSAHVLSILSGVVSASPQVAGQVASICAAKSHVVGPVFTEALARWPLYEEDIDSVILTLEVLKVLLGDASFCALLEPATTAATVQALADNARGDDLEAVVAACEEVLATKVLAAAGAQ